MLALIGGMALGAAAAAQTPSATSSPPDPCAGDPTCRQASAAELFAAADAAAAEGDLDGADALLVALTEDPNPDLRAEARFRLAALRERRGDLAGAAIALRALLVEKPDAGRARLELSRILALQGDDKAARSELRRASAIGLPPEVARTVRRFSTALNSLKRRGASLDLSAGWDSNVNRATSGQFVDTIIAPFELDADARSQSGMGISAGGEAWSRDSIFGGTLLTRVGLRGDFFLGKSRFNDLQFSFTSGPELTTRMGRFRPALAHERRWYGGDAYSRGYGASLNWLASASAKSQFQIDGSVVRQSIPRNPLLDGYRYSVSGAYDRAFTAETTLRLALRGALLDAKAKPESLRQAGGDALVAHILPIGTLFGQESYTRADGRAPLFLFGKTRHDERFDLAAGLIAHGLQAGGFSPLVRFVHTTSRSNIDLYEFRRTRIEFGLTREF